MLFLEETPRDFSSSLFKAYRLSLYGPRYVWMLVGQYAASWWEQRERKACTRRQLSDALAGCFTVRSLNAIIGNGISESGLVIHL